MSGLEGKRVLIVEDDVVNLTIMSMLLRPCGVQVIVFTPQVEELLADVEACATGIQEDRRNGLLPIDLILTDLMLSETVSGYDLVDYFQSIPALAGVPLVAVSAHNSVQAMVKARDKGFAGFITKPIRADSFPGYLSDILDGKPVWVSSDIDLWDLK